jgi:N-acetylglucosamine kinase-like BadF-type ATPase
MGNSGEVFLGIEGGGSRGRAAVIWDGRITARSLPTGLNPNDIGREVLNKRLRALILPLLALPSKPVGVLRVAAALAGVGRRAPRELCLRELKAILEPRCLRLHLVVTTDAEALLDRFFDQREGIVVIAGTGSICMGVRHYGRGRVTARAGGWDADLDRGCGFRLGLGVLAAVLETLEGRGERTLMVDLLCRQYGLALTGIPAYFLPVGRAKVAELARIALEASERGDGRARKLVREEAGELVEMTLAVARKLDLKPRTSIALSGGLFKNRRFLQLFKRRLKRHLPSACVISVADPLACILPRI